jgi:hypothetical protein
MPKHTMPSWLATLDANALAGLMARRPDSVAPPPRSLVVLADRLSTARSVRLALEHVDRTTVDVLAAAQAIGGDVTVADVVDRVEPAVDRTVVADAFDEAHRLGLLWPAEGDEYRLAPPLRSPTRSGPLRLHREPAAPQTAEGDGAVIDTAGGAAALRAMLGVERLIEVCSAAPVQLLRNGGGVGVKEVRRLAKAVGADEVLARLWLTLAYHADLLDSDDGAVVPTVAADDWLAGTPAERLVVLLRTWWESPGAPTMPDLTGKLPPALAHAYHDDERQVRHAVLGWFAGQPVGSVLLEPAELVTLLCWQRPGLCGEPDAFAVPFATTLAEAEALGVLAQGGLSSWGRALAAGGDVGVVGGWLPAPTGSARLQADLTAVVTGLPTGELSALLNLVADAGDRDTASTWRFSPDSVRRALDAGYTADRLVADLTAVATHGLPQPLEYLVRDMARRHGELSVVPVECCVLARDTTLATEIAAHRALGLRLLAPGVLASRRPVDETMSLLRRHGYAPVATDESGTPVVERARPRRAKQRAQYWSTPKPDQEPDLFLLATMLLDMAGADLSESMDVSGFAHHLSRDEQELLTRAIGAEIPVEIVYIDQNDRRSRRVITPYGHAGDLLEAWCHLRDDERHFLISRIAEVAPAPALD